MRLVGKTEVNRLNKQGSNCIEKRATVDRKLTQSRAARIEGAITVLPSTKEAKTPNRFLYISRNPRLKRKFIAFHIINVYYKTPIYQIISYNN